MYMMIAKMISCVASKGDERADDRADCDIKLRQADDEWLNVSGCERTNPTLKPVYLTRSTPAPAPPRHHEPTLLGYGCLVEVVAQITVRIIVRHSVLHSDLHT